MGRELGEALRLYAPARVTMVDGGGGVLARGDEPSLKSPLADTLALTACAELDVPVDVAVLGLGLDGELDVDYALGRIEELGGRPGPYLRPQHAEQVGAILSWHPPEASGMLGPAVSAGRG